MSPTRVSVNLNGPQIGELAFILCDLFDHDGLEQFTRIKLNRELFDDFASPNLPLKSIADALVAQLNKEGRTNELLDVLDEKSLRNAALKQFIARVTSGAGAPTTGEQAGNVRDAIVAVANLARADQSVRQLVGQSKTRFEITREELDRLAKYKALHDCLHNLQLQLSAITRATKAFPADETAGRELTTYVRTLQKQSAAMRKKTDELPTKDDEIAWLDDCDQALNAMQSALRSAEREPATAAAQGVKIGASVEALGQLLPEAVRINIALTNAAKNLRLDDLTTALRDLIAHLGQAGAVTDQLGLGHHALLGLAPQLAGLVDTHDGWQRVDKALSLADKSAPAPPANRVPRWPRIKALLDRLCPEGSDPDIAADPAKLAAQWEDTGGSAENVFIALRTAALHKFHDVDVQLLDLSDQLAEIVEPLDILLRVI